MKLKALFTEHPASVGETYWQHMGVAFSFAVRLLISGLCCLVHAVLPFCFVRTGSEQVTELYERMCENRSRLPKGSSGLESSAR